MIWIWNTIKCLKKVRIINCGLTLSKVQTVNLSYYQKDMPNISKCSKSKPDQNRSNLKKILNKSYKILKNSKDSSATNSAKQNLATIKTVKSSLISKNKR